MSSLFIKMENSSNLVQISTTSREGRTQNKTISLDNFLDLMTSFKQGERDTGYLHPNLLREKTTSEIKRAFYFKSIKTPKLQFRLPDTSIQQYFLENPYGIKVEKSYLEIPDFIYREVVAVITNSNNEGRSPTRYQIYNTVLDITGNITGKSPLHVVFPNQFNGHICWPDDFDSKILRESDLNLQSAFVFKYLNSRYNTDLWRKSVNYDKLPAEFLEKFYKFLDSVVSLKERLDSYSKFFLFYFFASNIEQINPLVLFSSDADCTLDNYFNS